MSETLSTAFGSHPYHHPGAFKDASANLSALQTFVKVYATSKDRRAKHYGETYSTPALPPIWTMKEFLTFGSSSRIFQCLEGSIKTHIATQFGVGSDQVFTNWVEALVDLRNICAHHDRLFNRSFQKQPSRLRSASVPTAAPNKLKVILECLDYMLAKRGLPSGITATVRKIILKYPEMQLAEAGF